VLDKLLMLYLDLAGVTRGVVIPYSTTAVDYRALFDASSVYGFEEVESSDLELRLSRDRVKEVPWKRGLYAGIASIHRAGGERYVKDSRSVAEKLQAMLEAAGLNALVGVEVEFYLFKSLRVEVAGWKQELVVEYANSTTPSYSVPSRRGYQVVDPVDYTALVREEVASALEKIGVSVVKDHHEVSRGQAEVTLKAASVVNACDGVVWAKYVARNISSMHGYTAVFLPKPLPGEAGSGMHVHVSLYDSSGRNMFSGNGGLSEKALYFIGGLLEHGRSLAALVAPTVNSYKRLVPGFEAPTALAWGYGNRSVAVRVPAVSGVSQIRIEFRVSDPLANSYLAIPAIILAGIDGIERKIEPPPPLNSNAYKYSARELAEMGYRTLPRNLEEALDELEADHEYLKPVFSRELIESYVEVKRREAREVSSTPSPAEVLYYTYW